MGQFEGNAAERELRLARLRVLVLGLRQRW
jgi:hypothetical protein